MPDNQVAVEFIASVKGADSIKAIDDAMKKADNTAKTHNKTVEAHGKTATNALGMSRREWMRTGHEAAFYLTSIASKSGEAGKALAETTAMATQLGESFMFGGGIGVGIAVAGMAISALTAKLQEAEAEAKKIVEPFENLRKEIDALARLKGMAEFAQGLGVSEEALRAYIGTAKTGWQEASKLNETKRILAENVKKLSDATRELGEIQKGLELGQYGDNYAYVQTRAGELQNQITVLNSAIAQQRGEIEQLTPALRANIAAQAEHNRQLNFYKSNLASAASELTSYRERMVQLAVTHRKAVAGFASDWAKAESDTLNRISGIYERLSEQLSEMAESASERRADAERDWLRAAEGFARDRARIERELADDIAGIQRDAVTRESDAKTWSEVLRIRREAKAREEDARKKATTARDELATRERDALGEHNYREGLAERAAMKAAERARRDADRQAESARQAGQATLDAIAKRRDAEIETYNQSALAAKKAHDARMRELLVTQTETEKLAAAWLIVRDNIDAATQALIVQSGVLRGVTGAGTTFPTWQSVYKHRGELAPHALGGSGTFPGVGTGERPYLISAQPGERYTITSKENAPGSTARGAMVFNNCTFRDTNDVLRALELYERGLV